MVQEVSDLTGTKFANSGYFIIVVREVEEPKVEVC